MVRCIRHSRSARLLHECAECPDASIHQCTEAFASRRISQRASGCRLGDWCNWPRNFKNTLLRGHTKHFTPKRKWCEALSLKSDRPYYVDFSVFDRSGKVSKSCNSEKFSKELWFVWVIPWNEACLKKQSYMISSGCMLRDFSKLPQNVLKNMIFDFSNDADFNFFLELRFRRAVVRQSTKYWSRDRLLKEFFQCPNGWYWRRVRQCSCVEFPVERIFSDFHTEGNHNNLDCFHELHL